MASEERRSSSLMVPGAKQMIGVYIGTLLITFVLAERHVDQAIRCSGGTGCSGQSYARSSPELQGPCFACQVPLYLGVCKCYDAALLH
jgi:hypothetical protein